MDLINVVTVRSVFRVKIMMEIAPATNRWKYSFRRCCDDSHCPGEEKCHLGECRECIESDDCGDHSET